MVMRSGCEQTTRQSTSSHVKRLQSGTVIRVHDLLKAILTRDFVMWNHIKKPLVTLWQQAVIENRLDQIGVMKSDIRV